MLAHLYVRSHNTALCAQSWEGPLRAPACGEKLPSTNNGYFNLSMGWRAPMFGCQACCITK